MSNQVKLSARPRAEAGRNAVGKVRARGAIPAVIYGAKDAATNLEVDKKDIENLLARAVGENILVELEIHDGEQNHQPTLAHSGGPASSRARRDHPCDFHAVSMNEEIDAEVVLEPEGEPIGVKTFGGLLAAEHALASDPVPAAEFARNHRRGCLRSEHRRHPCTFATSSFPPASPPFPTKS